MARKPRAQRPAAEVARESVIAARVVAVAILLAVCALIVPPAVAETLAPGQTIVVRYYAGDTLVKTLTVTPTGDAKWSVQVPSKTGLIDRADAVLMTGGTETTMTPAVATSEFRIGPGDVLDINVWDNQQVSRVVPVRPDGMISLPLLGDRRAAGQTTQEIKKSLEVELKRFIESPTVSVTVSQINSYKVFVQGAVTTPGSYPISGQSTITHAISMAGGFTEFADKGRLTIMRTPQNGETQLIKVNYNRILSGKDRDVVLEPGDTIVVP